MSRTWPGRGPRGTPRGARGGMGKVDAGRAATEEVGVRLWVLGRELVGQVLYLK